MVHPDRPRPGPTSQRPSGPRQPRPAERTERVVFLFIVVVHDRDISAFRHGLRALTHRRSASFTAARSARRFSIASLRLRRLVSIHSKSRFVMSASSPTEWRDVNNTSLMAFPTLGISGNLSKAGHLWCHPPWPRSRDLHCPSRARSRQIIPTEELQNAKGGPK
jgi:hypothetical protein